MSGLKQPGDSEYDVLGVSPKASDEEINRAFHRLIDGGGYKVGVPLNRQWLRAHQIKAAHATLSDPDKRRAYDESIGGTPGPVPWAMTANDPATDELVLSETQSAAAEAVEHRSTPEAVIEPDPNEPASTDAGLEPAPEREPDEEVAGSNPEEPLPPDLPPTANDNKRASLRRLAIPAVAVVGLALVALPSWQGWDRQPPDSDRAPGVTADAWRAGGAELDLSKHAAQTSGNLSATAPPNAEQQGAAPGASSAATDAPVQPLPVESGSDATTSQAVGELATADRAPTATTPAAAGQSPAPTEMAEASATAPAQSPPSAGGTVTATAPIDVASSDSLVRSPAQWLGGGPTDADNRRGRFQGTVAVQVNVDPDGRVSSCAPVRGSGNAGLDTMTCRLVQQRARFSPALDAQGRPVASQAYTTFVWGRRPRR